MNFLKSERFERHAPFALGLITFAVIWLNRQSVAAQFTPTGWQTSNLFGAVFNWAAVQSGFVFGIYGFVATKQDGFVGAVNKAPSFTRFMGYSRRAYLSGFALTAASLPIMVVMPSIADSASHRFLIVAIWFSCFIWTFCAFLRVAFIFGMIAATPEQRAEIPG